HVLPPGLRSKRLTEDAIALHPPHCPLPPGPEGHICLLPFTTCATSQKLGTFLPQSDATRKKISPCICLSSRLLIIVIHFYQAAVPNKSLKTLQLVQNATARVLTRTKKKRHAED
ncbi:hypothetical protein L3Q82_015466, partial [Scortum barcoo]